MSTPDPSTSSLSGIDLSRMFHRDIVRPLVVGRWPTLPFAAGRIGTGSDALALDDAMSTDHDWGLRLTLLVPDAFRGQVQDLLDTDLPESYLGLPVRFEYSGSQAKSHHVDVDSPAGFAIDRLGFHPCLSPTVCDWLSLTGQAALEVIAGPLFEDHLGEPTRIRQCLAWYPDALWRYLVACDWVRIDEELPLMSRAGDRGDALGSRVIASRLADAAVHLAFLLRRTWAPYSKWRGTFFARLEGVERLSAHLSEALDARTWERRQQAIGDALDDLIEIQASTALGARTTRGREAFFGRPYLRVETSIVADLMSGVLDPVVRSLPMGLGSIEQQSDNVRMLTDVALRRQVVGAVTSGR